MPRRPRFCSSLASLALAVALRAIFADYRRRANRRGRSGAITFVQRFGSALNLNVHFHCIVPDGVFLDDGGFLTAPPRADEEIRAVLARIVPRLRSLLEPLRTASNAAPESLDLEHADSVRALPKALPDARPPQRRTAFMDGFSLHAGVHLHANDREGLEHLCCYGARGPLSLQRLSLTEDGRVCYAMKRPMQGGRTLLVLSPSEFLRKLATLVPPPRGHLVRFHGVFARVDPEDPRPSRPSLDRPTRREDPPPGTSGSIRSGKLSPYQVCFCGDGGAAARARRG